jgi:hypothetical protein
MLLPIVLAHGSLGYWDELIFIGVAAVFIVVMGISWVKSRNTEPDFAQEAPESDNTEAESDAPDHFELS